MSAVDKIIAEEMNAGRFLPSDILTVRDTTPGVTDALYVNNVMDALGKTYPWFTGALERNETASIPTVKDILDKLGYTDDRGAKDGKGKFGWEKFVENFGKDIKDRPGRKGNMSKILGTPELGKRGWETVKKLWQQASHDKMLQDIAKERVDALDGSAGARLPLVGVELPVPVSKVLGATSGTAGKIFTPRTRKAWEEGREAGPEEFAMDLFQNAAYMAPIGGVGSTVARALGGSAAAKAAGTAVANALAPSAIVAGDYVANNKDYAGLADAALDAGVGTLTNLGVNRVIFPWTSTLLSAGLARTRRMPWLAEFLEGMKSDKEKARDLIREAETKLKNHFAETNSEYMWKIQNGKPVDRLSDEQLKDYIDILNARDVLGDELVVKKFSDAMKGMREAEQLSEGYNPAAKIRKLPLSELDDFYPVQSSKRSMSDIIDGALGRVGYRSPEEVAAWDIKDFVSDKGGNQVASASRALKAHPELVSQYDRPRFREILALPRTGVDVGKSWTINRLGDDAAAQRAFGRAGIDVKDIRKEQDKARKEKKAARDVANILDADKSVLDDRDRKFLADVAGDPDIMTNGHPTDPEGFKLWLLQKGHDLLSGTSVARPTWEVK